MTISCFQKLPLEVREIVIEIKWENKDLQLEIVFEKHTQELATYKVSGYEKFFMKDIELWEKKLTNIIDSFEFWLMVQKN